MKFWLVPAILVKVQFVINKASLRSERLLRGSREALYNWVQLNEQKHFSQIKNQFSFSCGWWWVQTCKNHINQKFLRSKIFIRNTKTQRRESPSVTCRLTLCCRLTAESSLNFVASDLFKMGCPPSSPPSAPGSQAAVTHWSLGALTHTNLHSFSWETSAQLSERRSNYRHLNGESNSQMRRQPIH